MKKNNKKKIETEVIVEETPVVEEVIIEPESILTEEEVKELKDDEVIDVIISEEIPVVDETPVENTEVITSEIVEENKKLCKILLATPTYYVVNKNGVSLTINAKNNYKRGDEILM